MRFIVLHDNEECFNEALMHIFYSHKIDWNLKKMGEKFLRLKEVEKLLYR